MDSPNTKGVSKAAIVERRPTETPIKIIGALLGLIGATAISATAHAQYETSQTGIASTYANGKTASGEQNRAGGLTAAHRSLPFGTVVRIVNEKNGRSVTVRIDDRGPFIRGRVIDVSPEAARVLGISGLAPVMLVILRNGG